MEQQHCLVSLVVCSTGMVEQQGQHGTTALPCRGTHPFVSPLSRDGKLGCGWRGAYVLLCPPCVCGWLQLTSPVLQDRKLEQKGRDWRGAYMMPTQMDRAVTAFRRWLSEHAGPLQYDPRSSRAAVQQELSREQLLDRYNQHVKHCTVCSTVST